MWQTICMGKFGVFSLESEWDHNLTNKETVRPLLEVLENSADIKFIHRRVATKSELKYFLDLWVQRKYDDYKMLTINTHGDQKRLWLHTEEVTLKDLKEWIGERGQERTLYLGGCEILKGSEKDLKKFLRETKLKALIGYTRYVEWIEAAALELLIFQTLSYKTPGWARNYLENNYKYLVEKLGMKFIIR